MMDKRGRVSDIEPPVTLLGLQAGFSRRDFLKIVGVVTGSILLPSCTSQVEISSSATSTSLPTQTQLPLPTSTTTPEPTPTRTPGVTSTPKFEFDMHVTAENKFDFSRMDEYPRLKDLKGDLTKFIKESEQRGLMRDFSQATVTDMALHNLDNRNSQNNERSIAIAYAAFNPIPLGTQPFHEVSGAKISYLYKYHTGETYQANAFVFLQQHYVPDAGGKSIMIVGLCPDYEMYYERLALLHTGMYYGALMGAFAPEVVSAKVKPRGNFETTVNAIAQNGVYLTGDKAAEAMLEQNRILPEADGKIFLFEPLFIRLE